MQLSPISSGAGRLGGAMPHVLSMLQALCPGTGRIASPSFETVGEGLRLAFAYLAGDARVSVEVELVRSDQTPRPAAYAIDGRWALGAQVRPPAGVGAPLRRRSEERGGSRSFGGFNPQLRQRARGRASGPGDRAEPRGRRTHADAGGPGSGLRARHTRNRGLCPERLVRSWNWSYTLVRRAGSGRAGRLERGRELGRRHPRLHGQAATALAGAARRRLRALAPGGARGARARRARPKRARPGSDLHQPRPHHGLQLRLHALHRLGHPEHPTQVQRGRASRLARAHDRARLAVGDPDRGRGAYALPQVRELRVLLEGARSSGVHRVERQSLRPACRGGRPHGRAGLDPPIAGLRQQ